MGVLPTSPLLWHGHADRAARICTKVRQPKANSIDKEDITT